MGLIESEILESLVALCESEPHCERHMFVVAVNPVNAAMRFAEADVRTMRAGEVLMVCRPDEPPRGLPPPPRVLKH